MAEQLSPQIEAFYQNTDLVLPGFLLRDREIVAEDLHISRSPDMQNLSDDRLAAAYEDIDRSFQIIESRKFPGRFFETAQANLSADPGDTESHYATYSSCLIGNDGNTFEVARRSALTPDRRQFYLGSFGRGGTSPLTQKEQAHYRKNGTLTYTEDGKVRGLPTIQALQDVMDMLDVKVTRFNTTSAGGRVALAHGCELPEGQVSHGFLSVPPNMSDISPRNLVTRMLIKERRSTGPREVRLSPDKWKVTKVRKQEARQATPHIYSESHTEVKGIQGGAVSQFKSLKTTMHALGLAEQHGDPLAQDLAVFLSKQTNAKLTLVCAERDPLNEGINLEDRTRRLLGKVARQGADVAMYTLPGLGHGYNTNFPEIHYALFDAAFSR